MTVMFTQFEQLDDVAFFKALVTAHLTANHWTETMGYLARKPILDPASVEFAHTAYQSNLAEWGVRLESGDPDHYKRAGSFLDALNRAQVVKDYDLDGMKVSSLKDGTCGLPDNERAYRLRLIEYFTENCNQATGFDLAFRCCEVYEPLPKQYSKNYLQNVLSYLHDNPGQNLSGLFMLFKTYWSVNDG